MLYADARHWLSQGWCDYLAPQLYWGIEPAKQSFPVLLNWWRQQSHGKPIWPGIATERVGAKRPASEMARQIELTRQGDLSNNAPGHIHWSMKALMTNQGGVSDLLRNGVYGERAGIAAPLNYFHWPGSTGRRLSMKHYVRILAEGAYSTTDYRILTEVSRLQEHEAMLVRGWRRFGLQYFRPQCTACMECVSLRVAVATFQPTKSQRRAVAQVRTFEGRHRAAASRRGTRLALFHAWHGMREQARGWKPSPMTADEYSATFCPPNPCATGNGVL